MSKRVAAALGVLGEILITLGVLLGLFVVWQLWWTDVVGERAQAAVVADLGWAPPIPQPLPTTEDDDGVRIALPQSGPTPVVDRVGEAQPLATLLVPRWGADYQRAIHEGVSRRHTLDPFGIGRYPHSAMPGEIGNFALAGHRTTFGKPFNRIEEIEIGDALVVRTEEWWFVYRVTETRIVLPHHVEVVAPVPGDRTAAPTEAFITLTTCHPMFSARERYIVHGVFEYWAYTADGFPVEVLEGAESAALEDAGNMELEAAPARESV